VYLSLPAWSLAPEMGELNPIFPGPCARAPVTAMATVIIAPRTTTHRRRIDVPPRGRQYTRAVRPFTVVILAAALVVTAATAHAQGPVDVKTLLRDLKNPDYDAAYSAINALDAVTQPRAEIVTGLLDALRTGEWNRCSGDMRDYIARRL